MLKTKNYYLLAALALFAGACATKEVKEKPPVFNSDIKTAVEIKLQGYSTDKANTGYGDILEIDPTQLEDPSLFNSESNSNWYRFSIPDSLSDNTMLSFSIVPKDENEDYNFLLFKYTNRNFAADVKNGNIKPLRGNMAINSEYTGSMTGLSCEASNAIESTNSEFTFSKAIAVNPREVYYLVIDNRKEEGKGYDISFSTCSGGEGELQTYAQVSEEPVAATVVEEEETTREFTVATTQKKNTKPRYKVLPLREGEEYYTVEPQNTVYSTSKAYGMTVEELMELNNLTSYHIEIGQKLRVKRRYAQDESTLSQDVSTVQKNINQEAVATKPVTSTTQTNTVAEKTSTGAVAAPKPAGTQALVSNTPPATPVKQNAQPATPAEKNAGVASADKVPVSTSQPASTATKSVTANEPVKKAAEPATKTSNNAPAPGVEKVNVPTRTHGKATAGTAEDKNKLTPGKTYYMFMHVVNEANGKPVTTTLKMIDGRNPKRFEKLPSNKVAPITVNADESSQKIFLCETFGYRKQDFVLNFNNILNDSTRSFTSMVEDTIVIRFDLERYKKKDVVVMYNVFFYDDASVMLPISKYELESLLDLMKENEKVKIRLHGHTNGNSLGKIVKLEADDNNFFNVSAKNKESYGSAAQLSKYRAESIMYYLLYHGISADRVDIKGWGGKSPLYERNNPLAYKNKRVEVEIVEDGISPTASK